MFKFVLFVALCATSPAAASRFNCTVSPPPPYPSDISKLHPGHVSVVMAMGDSITAAFAVRATLLEGRDISWSIGTGTSENLTVPWLMQNYNRGPYPLEGMSTAAVIPNDPFHLPHNDYHPETDHMNVAESEGSIARGSMTEQWAFILEQLPKYKDLDKRWKVLTVWMTANDVCGHCDGPMNTAYWVQETNELLVNVSKTFTNIYVNLISTLDLSNVARLQRSVVYCDIEHRYILNECGCIDKGNATQLQSLDDNVHTMNAELHVLAAQWYTTLQQQNRTDMAVVVQAFQEGLGATLDIGFLNKLDCFHPSELGHEDLAIGLWNSMLCTDDRINRCGFHFTDDMVPTCPTADSVFYTGPDVIPGPPPKRAL